MRNNLKWQASIFTSGSVMYLSAQWMLTVLTTRFLGYENVGVLTLAMSVGNVLVFIQLYGVRNFQSSDVIRQYTSGDYLYSRLLTTILGWVCCTFFILISGYNQKICAAIILFTLFRSFEVISDTFYGDFQREGRLELIGITLFVRGILTIVLFWLAIKTDNNLNHALLVITFGSLCVTLFLDSLLYRKIVPWNPGSYIGIRDVLKKCFPLMISSLLPSVITAFPRIILEQHSGTELLGYYGNISTPAVIITAVVPNILASIMPVYGKMAEEKKYREMKELWLKTILGTIVILMFCLVGVLLFGKPVLTWVYTNAIEPYIPYLYLLLISTTIYAFTMCGASLLIALRKNVAVSICATVPTIVCVIISEPLIKQNSISGAIASLTISYLIQVILQWVAIMKYTKNNNTI